MKKNITNKKFNNLITAANRLFLRFGIKRVPVNEICREARVSRMTFYKYFENKTELLKYIIDDIVSRQMTEYNQIMVHNVPFSEKVKDIIKLKNDHTKVMSLSFFHELWQESPSEITDLLEKASKESFQVVLNDFKQAQKSGDIRQDINLKFILFFLEHIKDMAKDENLLKLYSSPNELVLELTNFFFYGILKIQGSRGGK
jgi:AcrR family transcriptional regulator